MRRTAWLKCLTVLPMTMLLGGCPNEPSEVVRVVCPVIKQYTPEQQQRALEEYRALPAGSMIKQMFGDYSVLRDRVRACRK
jgi:coenzyme F420-reducing hydrogenase gamma subunit